jgi:tetratricopeptide (TPR) repeat protein
MIKKLIKATFFFLALITNSIFFSPNLPAQDLSLKQLFRRSYSLYQEGKCGEAIEIANKIIEINSQFYPAYNLIGFCKTREKDNIMDAIFNFEQGLKINPKQPQIYNIISVFYKELGMDEKSFSYIKAGLKHNPGSFVLNFNAGITELLINHNPQDAVDYFKKAQKIKPAHQRLLYLLGVSYLFSQQKEMALDTIIRLREIDGWDFAWQLEELIRKIEKGEDINFGQVLGVYNNQPKKEKIKKEPENKRGKVQAGDSNITIKGKGSMQIKQKYRRAD